MNLFDAVIFLKGGSTKDDMKNIALELIILGIKSFHMSDNNEYIIVFNYENKTWEQQFEKIPGVSSVFMRPKDKNHKENSHELVMEFSNSRTVIKEPQIIHRSKSVSDALEEIKEYTGEIEDIKSKSPNGRMSYNAFVMMAKKPSNIKKSGRTEARTQNFPDIITPDVWKEHFHDYAVKYGMIDIAGSSKRNRAHPCHVLNTYLVYLHTKSWEVVTNHVAGKLADYCSASTARMHIENWSLESILGGIMDIYEKVSME